MWKSCVRGKQKFFFWLLLKDRLSTRNLLRRKHMSLPDYNCVLCTINVEETLQHLFFECSFNKWCWRFVNVYWNTQLTPQNMIIQSHSQFNSRIFREVIMVAGWSIWCYGNVVIFDGAPVSLGRWKDDLRRNSLLLFKGPNLPPRFC
jgi:hypothetical protein